MKKEKQVEKAAAPVKPAATEPVPEKPATEPAPEKDTTQLAALIQSYATANGFTADEQDRTLKLLQEIAQAYADRKFTPEMVETVMKGISHDRRMTDARQEADRRMADARREADRRQAIAEQEAELRGRNAKIEAKMRSLKTTDGVPHLGSSAYSQSASRGIFSLAEQAR